MLTTIFYILSAVALLATLMAITRRNPVHAVIYLVHAFFALALIFYQLGAPLVAAWEVIIYAGAIMVLFLFIIMMLELTPGEEGKGPGWGQWLPVLLLGGTIAACTILLLNADPRATEALGSHYVSPRDFGYALFKDYALAVEVVSFQLLFAAVGAFYVGKGERGRRRARGDER
ncbi:MAG: NADH-quinone oxidoreductase subunit J [Geothermobacteraceae bacterium]